MGVEFKQQDFYDIDAIQERLSAVLGSDAWQNLQNTDIGKQLIQVCANTIHLDAMAFFNGLNQVFKSTVSEKGYLEEIAKSKGVIPRTYTSATLSVSIVYNITSEANYAPMDLSVEVQGKRFYNIVDVKLIQNTPQVITLHEGQVVREANTGGKPSAFAWSYGVQATIQSELVGNKEVRKYLILPTNVLVDSITVDSAINFSSPQTRWGKTESWFDNNQTSRVWKLGKDYVGRYLVNFGDGVYGRKYVTTEIMGIKYLLSSGAGVSVTNYNTVKVYSQDVYDVSGNYTVSVIGFADGASEISLSDLAQEIEVSENKRKALIQDTDYENYLESRSDVLFASVQTERKNSPPNIEFFNTVKYCIKPIAENSGYNDADIQEYLTKHGLETVDFMNMPTEKAKFSLGIQFGVLTGYTFATVQSAIQTIVEGAFTWNTLGFGEVITYERVFALISGVEGLNLSTLNIQVFYIDTDKDTGDTELTVHENDLVTLRFYPKRFRLYIKSTDFTTDARDDSNGNIYGDIAGGEAFDVTDKLNMMRTSTNIGGMVVLGTGSVPKLIDLRKATGGVSNVQTGYNVVCSTWCETYKELLSIEVATTPRIRAYNVQDGFVEIGGRVYLQNVSDYTFRTSTKELNIGSLPAGTSIACCTYLDNYLYIAFTVDSAASFIKRYHITNTDIVEDTYYNDGVGFITLSGKPVLQMVGTMYGFNTGKAVLYMVTDNSGAPTESGLDIITEVNDTIHCNYEPDFFNGDAHDVFATKGYTGITWGGISTDGQNLYCVLDCTESNNKTKIVKLYSMSDIGLFNIVDLSDNSIEGLCGPVFYLYNGVAKVYAYSTGMFNYYSVPYNGNVSVPVKRAGQNVTGNSTSIVKVGELYYDTMTLKYLKDMVCTLMYEVEDETLTFSSVEIVSLDSLEITGN